MAAASSFVFAVAAVVVDATALVAPPVPAQLPAAEQGGVPLNPLIVVGDPASDVRLKADGGVDVAFDTDGLAGVDFVPLLQVVPRAPLAPLTHHRLVSVTVDVNGLEEEQAELTSFTTGEAVDDTAPVVDVSFDNNVVFVDGADGADGADDVVAVDVRQDGGPSQLLALSGGAVGLTSLSGRSDVVLTVVAFDAAGNAADPVDVDASFVVADFAKPEVGACCAASSSKAPSLSLALLALLGVVVNFRRRAANFCRKSPR